MIMLGKEVKNAFRNRSLMLFILLIPLIILPILILVPPIFANPALNPSPVLIINLDNGAQGANLTRQISQTQGLAVTVGNANSSAQASVQSGLYDAALVIPPNFSTIIAQNQTAPIQLYYDTTYSRSTLALGLLNAALLSYSQQIVILRNSGRSSLIPIGVNPTPLTGVRPLIAAIGFIFPTILVGWAAVGGAYLALDMGATEEGESVLTSLLASPYTRFEILAGKTFFIGIVAILLAALSVLGIYAIPTLGVLIGSGFRDLTVVGSIPLSAGLIGTVALGVGLSFAVAAFLFRFVSVFLTGAGRAKIALAGIVGSAASTVFLLSTNQLNLGFGANILPVLGGYNLLSRVLLGTATIADVGLVTLGSVIFGLLFFLLTYHEFAGAGFLLHTTFAASKEKAEIEAQPQPEKPGNDPSLSELSEST